MNKDWGVCVKTVGILITKQYKVIIFKNENTRLEHMENIVS